MTKLYKKINTLRNLLRGPGTNKSRGQRHWVLGIRMRVGELGGVRSDPIREAEPEPPAGAGCQSNTQVTIK